MTRQSYDTCEDCCAEREPSTIIVVPLTAISYLPYHYRMHMRLYPLPFAYASFDVIFSNMQRESTGLFPLCHPHANRLVAHNSSCIVAGSLPRLAVPLNANPCQIHYQCLNSGSSPEHIAGMSFREDERENT